MKKKERFKYACKRCGTQTEHKHLARLQAWCEKCGRITAHRLIGPAMPQGAAVQVGARLSSERASLGPVLATKPSVAVTHEPIFGLEMELAGASEAVPREGATPTEEELPAETPEAGLILDEKAWSDFYQLPAEAVSLALNDPELELPAESCRVQGVRIARFCARHNIVLPSWIDAVPIASRAAGDYARLFRGIAVVMKERRAMSDAPTAPEEVTDASGETLLTGEQLKKIVEDRR